MFLKSFISFCLVIVTMTSSLAKELSYAFGQKSYKITYDEKVLHFKTVDIDLRFDRSTCFEKDFVELYALLDNLAEDQVLLNQKKGDLSLQYNDKSYLLTSQSIVGQRLLSLPRTFIQYKMMENEVCKK